ncbi:MAG: deoxyribodipyrimidine photo-lyase [Proteobacteria bacterium]|nr:deoxyribodipyrimidine photo-lyase [Pseudomonadota bacterium]
MVNQKRVRILEKGKEKAGPVVYWMSRDQRTRDNWALLFAQELALERREPMGVVFCLVPRFLDATMRHYDFMLKGIQEAEKELTKKNIPFFLLPGIPEEEIPSFVNRNGIGTLVSDFEPLRIKRGWKKRVGEQVDIPLYEVDARNVVPCWIASPKQEYGAYTLRPKIRRVLPDYLEDFPLLRKHPISWKAKSKETNWDGVRKTLDVDRSVSEVNWIQPGEKSAQRTLRKFIREKLPRYDELRNDPPKDGTSNLSPYLHFGQISAQRVALEVSKTTGHKKSKDALLEELIVRRELSDNFCFYNPNYDNFEGFPDWAKKTLDDHRRDRREYIYSLEDFQNANTHDRLWNAAQREMVEKGKMHGYMRMYWGKKILEWTASPEEATKIAIYLNDRYELDGRDTNGYTGVAWCIGGVHDRAWPTRPIFGKIRYMSYNGCKSKFDVIAYIQKNRA